MHVYPRCSTVACNLFTVYRFIDHVPNFIWACSDECSAIFCVHFDSQIGRPSNLNAALQWPRNILISRGPCLVGRHMATSRSLHPKCSTRKGILCNDWNTWRSSWVSVSLRCWQSRRCCWIALHCHIWGGWMSNTTWICLPNIDLVFLVCHWYSMRVYVAVPNTNGSAKPSELGPRLGWAWSWAANVQFVGLCTDCSAKGVRADKTVIS